MSAANPLSLSERLHNALNQPSLVMRIQEVSQLLQEVSSKDGGYILRTIIESIFGTSEESMMSLQQQQLGGGWGLRIITQTEHHGEFQAMRTFLSPHGPLLNLIYRLSHDPLQLLPFQIAWLPGKVRAEIQEGNAGPFYTNRIQNVGPGKTPTNILFNAFEYYFFHFGHFLVANGAQQWNLFWTSVRDALYPTLFEDYLSAYLPCDANLPPGPLTAPVSPRGVLSPVSQSPHSLSLLVSPIGSPFRSFYHNPHMEPTVGSISHGSTHQTSSPIHPTVSPYSEVSTWTSQTLIQVLMEIWINLCISPPKVTSGHHQSPGFTSLQSSLSYSHPSLKDVFVPTADHVRAVRMMVKHFHYFTNSQKPQYPSPLDHLRRNIWPMCRKSFYHFIEHLFIHWPLDSSFRLVLETWLSYIQPWRYITYMPLERNTKMAMQEGEIPRSVELKWKGFIAENLLFYSHLFSLFLKRSLKLDLASPKNAQILFRVTKVFSQENLFSMIQEVEELIEINQIQKSSLGLFGGVTTPCAIASVQDSTEGQHLPQVISQMVRSHILEVEKPNFSYTPLFGEATRFDVSRLVGIVKRTCDTLSAELIENKGSDSVPKKELTGWFGSLMKSIFDSPRTREEENSVEEMSKCVSHLEASMSQFCILFNVTIPETTLSSSVNQRIHGPVFSDSLLGTPEKTRIPDQTLTESGLILTNHGRYQVLNGLRRMDLKYEGDPDLRPICTFEIGFLVRLLYSFAKFLNSKYKAELTDLYYRQDFIGRVSRVFIKPPETVYEYCREIEVEGFQKKIPKDLPPRLSLRSLAHKRVILFFIILYLFSWICGVPFIRVIFQIAIPSFIAYILGKVTLQLEIFDRPDRPHLVDQ